MKNLVAFPVSEIKSVAPAIVHADMYSIEVGETIFFAGQKMKVRSKRYRGLISEKSWKRLIQLHKKNGSMFFGTSEYQHINIAIFFEDHRRFPFRGIFGHWSHELSVISREFEMVLK